MPFFTHARACTNMYAYGPRGWGGGYGHDFKNVQEAELVHWMGATIRHGAREGTPGSLHTRWDKGDPNMTSLFMVVSTTHDSSRSSLCSNWTEQQYDGAGTWNGWI